MCTPDDPDEYGSSNLLISKNNDINEMNEMWLGTIPGWF